MSIGVAVMLVLSPGVHAAGNLLGHWKLDETVAGQNAEESTGTGNHGLPTNDPVPSTDIPPVSFPDPRSASFDGTQYFTIDRPVQDDFTICAWVKTASTGGGVDHWTSAPIMDSETGGVDFDFGFGIGNSGRLMFGNGGLVGGNLEDHQVNGTTQINDSIWHNVCVSRDNTNGDVKLYVDAQLDGSGTTGIGSLNSNPYAMIGYGFDGAALFEGLIDDIRVYDSVLTPAQLQNLTDGSDDPDTDPNAPSVQTTSTQNGNPATPSAPNTGLQRETVIGYSALVATGMGVLIAIVGRRRYVSHEVSKTTR